MMEDFLKFFNLQRDPFQDTIDPDIFFPTEIHEQVMLKLTTGLSQRRPIMMLWGSSGTGKTILTHLLLNQLDPEKFLPLLILPSPQITPAALLDLFCQQLGGPKGRQASKQEKLTWLQQRIIKESEKGRQTVCLVDEAHFLKSESLHLIRSMSNWESSWGKLLSIIFMAEPPFIKRLKHPAHASIRSRISLSLELPPLSTGESEQLIKFRLLVSGGNPRVFVPGCYPLIHQASGGVPRIIIKIAGNALLESYCQKENQVSPATVNTAVAESC